MARHPVITGLGVIASPGCGVETIWEAVAGHRDGLKPLTLFPSPRHGSDQVGEVSLDLLKLGAPRKASRGDRLGWLAAREAIHSAGLPPEAFGDRAGIVFGCSVGGSFDSEGFLIKLIKEGKFRPGPTRFHECHSTADLIADSFGLFGPSMTVSTACSSSALAIDYEIVNAGVKSLRNFCFGFYVDSDIGPLTGPVFWIDDLCGFTQTNYSF